MVKGFSLKFFFQLVCIFRLFWSFVFVLTQLSEKAAFSMIDYEKILALIFGKVKSSQNYIY